MKKALFLVLSLAFLLTACGELPDTSEQNPADVSEAAPAAAHVCGSGKIIAPMD